MPLSIDSLISHLNSLGFQKPFGVYEQQGAFTLLLCLQQSGKSEYVCFSEIQVLSSGHIVIDLLLCDPDHREKRMGAYMMYKIEQLASRILPSQPMLHSACVIETMPLLKKWGFTPPPSIRLRRSPSFFNDPGISNLDNQEDFNGICVKMNKETTASNAMQCPEIESSACIRALHHSDPDCLEVGRSLREIKEKLDDQWRIGVRSYEEAWGKTYPNASGLASEPAIKISQLWLHEAMEEAQLTNTQRNDVIKGYFGLRVAKNSLAVCKKLLDTVEQINDGSIEAAAGMNPCH